MPFFHTCCSCGAHLDPGERCECESRDVPELEEARRAPARKHPPDYLPGDDDARDDLYMR